MPVRVRRQNNFWWNVKETVQLLDYHQDSDTAFLVCGKDSLNRGGEIVFLHGFQSTLSVVGR